MVFVRFKDWSARTRADLKVQAVLARTAMHFASYQQAVIIPINPPSIPALGTASGFDLELEDRGGIGHDALVQARDQLLATARQDPNLTLVRANGLPDNPAYKIDIDREKASAFGVNLSDVDQTFSIAWGSRFVNNFLDTDGRIKKVYVQADAPFRMNPDDLKGLYVRNVKGSMVPFTSFATGAWSYGSPKLERYNGVSSFEIQGQAVASQSTGQAMAVAKPPAAAAEWVTNGRASVATATVDSAGAIAVRASLLVLLPGGALRKLVDSDFGDHGRAARRPWRARRGQRASPGERRLLPGRPADHDRPVVEECDSDRRVRA
jgi:multidrug efflux pump